MNILLVPFANNKNTNYDVSLYSKTTENLFRMGGIEPEIIDSNFLVPLIC